MHADGLYGVVRGWAFTITTKPAFSASQERDRVAPQRSQVNDEALADFVARLVAKRQPPIVHAGLDQLTIAGHEADGARSVVGVQRERAYAIRPASSGSICSSANGGRKP